MGQPQEKPITMSALPAPVRAAIRERRVQLGLTQVEASAAGGISPATWNSVEKGRSSASSLVRAQICRALGWTLDSIDLLTNNKAPVNAAPGSGSDDSEDSALADVAREVARLADEVARQRTLIDRLVEAELARREEDRKRQ